MKPFFGRVPKGSGGQQLDLRNDLTGLQSPYCRGRRPMRLYTSEVMTENQTLYKHCGYAETHRKEEHGARRIYMAKRLSPDL